MTLVRVVAFKVFLISVTQLKLETEVKPENIYETLFEEFEKLVFEQNST